MNRTEETLTILERLISGIHPVTGEMLPDDHVCLEDDVRRALEHAYGCMARQQDAPEEAKFVRKNGKLNAGRPWTQEDDAELVALMEQGVDIEEIARKTMRRKRGIANRYYYLVTGLQPATDNRKSEKHPNMGQPWYAPDDELLCRLFREGWTLRQLCEHFGRSPGGITRRLERHGFILE